jgi:hypothetical protein
MPKGFYNRYKIPKAAKKIADALEFESLIGRPPKKGEWVKRGIKRFKNMKDMKPPNPPGPVPKVINWELFEQLCAIQCTQSEIASMLKIDADTLRSSTERNYKQQFSVVYKQYSETGKCSLRRYQFVQSKDKPNMAIWLGKQWLSQKDNEVVDTAPNAQIISLLLSEIQSLKGKMALVPKETEKTEENSD